MQYKLKNIIISLLPILALLIIFIYREFKFRQIKNTYEEKQVEIKFPTIKINKPLFTNYYKKAQLTLNKMSLEEKIGQLFLVRYNNHEVEKFVNYYPGGYILFAKDFENHTKKSLKEELLKTQAVNSIPLIIGVDEEGGYVTRVSRFKSFRNEKFLSPKEYYETGGLELLEKIENEKYALLKDLGINLNLAPVADISVNKEDYIYNRTFGYDAKKTSKLIAKMVTYANNNQINSCLKHFPGYGNNRDTHKEIAKDKRSYKELKNNDFLPFQAGIIAKVPCVLVSHNIINAIDSETPASLSKNVIDELRNTLGFTGIVITDDLAMDAVNKYVENNQAATLAINAGNDMIITSDFLTMYKEILNSVKNKKITQKKLDKAVLRILAWKYNSKLIV